MRFSSGGNQEWRFVATLRGHVEQRVGTEQCFRAAREGRIGVKHLSLRILRKHAVAGQFLDAGINRLVIVFGTVGCEFVRCEGNMEIVVEVVAERRHPVEMPPHPLLVGFDFGERSARHRNIGDIALRQMRKHTFDMIGAERTADAAFRPPRRQHEMIDDQLALVVEQLRQRLEAGRRVEGIFLLDLHPR
jgi:hypothetical protein